MRISLVIEPYFQQNIIFDPSNLEANRDDCLRQYIELRNSLQKKNISLDTVDILSIEDADIVIFINVPDNTNPYFQKALKYNKICYVLINELEHIHKMNTSINAGNYFKKIFTYQQDLIDNNLYFKVNYSFDFSEKWKQFKPVSFSQKKFATMIAGNKKLDHPLELYSERVKTIRWFEKNHPEEFDLYGIGWNSYKNRVQKFFSINFKTYKGKVNTKKDILSNYKFNICYENAKNVPGWITEKIFDSFFAATVPVYWGWDGIEKFLDKNCFIDRSDFKNESELYLFLKSISESEYNKYINNITTFLKRIKDDSAYEFSIKYYVKKIEEQLLNDIFKL
jgi:hypothetical protein